MNLNKLIFSENACYKAGKKLRLRYHDTFHRCKQSVVEALC